MRDCLPGTRGTKTAIVLKRHGRDDMGEWVRSGKLLNDNSKTTPGLIVYEQLPSCDLHLANSHWSGQYNPPPCDTSAVQTPENQPLPQYFVMTITTTLDCSCDPI